MQIQTREILNAEDSKYYNNYISPSEKLWHNNHYWIPKDKQTRVLWDQEGNTTKAERRIEKIILKGEMKELYIDADLTN